MKKKIITVIVLTLLIIVTFSGCTEIDDVPEKTEDSGQTHWYNYLNPETIRLQKNNGMTLYDYSSNGLRRAIDDCHDSPFYKIHIPSGNLTAYGKHHGHDCNFYIRNISNLTIYTDGINSTRFLVFEDRTVFRFSNITNCHFNDFNFTMINDITSPIIDMTREADGSYSQMHGFNRFNTIRTYWCHSFCNCSDFWYKKVFMNVMNSYGYLIGDTEMISAEDLKIYMNESFANNRSIRFFDRNGTVIFEGDYTNETLMNTSLNITLRQFIITVSAYQNLEAFRDVVEQIADQLKPSAYENVSYIVPEDNDTINSSSLYNWKSYQENETRIEDIRKQVRIHLDNITFLAHAFDIYIDNLDLIGANAVMKRLRYEYYESVSLMEEFWNIMHAHTYLDFYYISYLRLDTDMTKCKHDVNDRDGLMCILLEIQGEMK